MKLRITLLIPALLVFSSTVSSVLVYFYAKTNSEEMIRKEVLSQTKLDITRLQNVLYNSLTENKDNIEDARLNLSVTAMDPKIHTLLITDEYDRIIIANRYLYENNYAPQVIKYFDKSTALQVKKNNIPVVKYLETDKNILTGYYPVVLQLESKKGLPTKRVGILFVELNIANKLTGAYRLAAEQSYIFAGIMMVVSMLVAWLLHKLVSRRLNKLTETSKKLASGNLDARVGLYGTDELALLGNVFDEMATRIKEDIHHRMKAASELRGLNETLEQRVAERTKLLNNAQSLGHLGNWSWKVGRDELYWSDELFKIFGYQPNEIKPSYMEFMSMLHSADANNLTDEDEGEESKFKESYYRFDHRILLPDGDERWVHEEVILEISDDGKNDILSGTIQDITERKIFENSLRDAKIEAERLSEAKSDFLSRMSHELRTPMNAILGFSQLLSMEPITDKQHSFVGEIATAGNHLLALIGDLLDLSRIESGKPLVELKAVVLKDVVDEAIKITESLILENDLKLRLDCKSACKVTADKIRLRQVLVNLLSNAAKYNNKGHSINVTCLVKNKIIKVMVTDEGDGIDSEKLDKLFTPFERLGAEFTGIDGTGVGLALSKQLIELMKGKIGVESSPGVGSTFWIEIPLAK